MKLSIAKRASIFTFMATLGLIGFAPAEEGCTHQQGTDIKNATKEGLSFAQEICLSGLLDRVDLPTEDKLAACAITSILKDAANFFLVTEKQQRTLQRALTARGIGTYSTPLPATNDASIDATR